MSWTMNASLREGQIPAGTIPAVLYGGGATPTKIYVDLKEMLKLASSEDSWNLGELKLGGKSIRCSIKEIQAKNTTGYPIHIDFLDIAKAKSFSTFIAIETTGVSVGVKRGGVLNLLTQKLEVKLSGEKITSLPKVIQIDISELQINDVVHLSAIKLPNGIIPAHPARDATILNVVPPAGGMSKATDAPSAKK